MTTLHRVVCSWQGPQIQGAAVTVLHYSASDNPAPPTAAIAAAFDAMKQAMPVGITVTVPGSGETIDDTTGHLTGIWSTAQPAAVAFSGAQVCAAGVGACVSWTTGGIVPGKKGPRRLRGRTFIVPVPTASYDGNGNLSAAATDAYANFAAALQAAGPLAVWHRPTTVGGSDGNSYGVVAHNVSRKVAFLKSRRD